VEAVEDVAAGPKEEEERMSVLLSLDGHGMEESFYGAGATECFSSPSFSCLDFSFARFFRHYYSALPLLVSVCVC
jgi:hypothetical protein